MISQDKERIVSVMFEPVNIGPMRLANRFVRSATWEGMADDDGAVTQRLTDLMAQLARGGVGLIISGHAYVSPEGKAGKRQLGCYDDSLIFGLSEMAGAVHQAGGCIALQLAHAGLQAPAKLTGGPPVGPSPDPPPAGSPGRELTPADIADLAAAFGRAASRARAAGFDAVQIHAAHGYLLSQFLSPAFNHRTDDYGGPIENRARALLQVYAQVRAAVGEDFPVMVKINAADFLDGGLTAEDSIQAAQMLVQAGLDAVEVSGGTPASGRFMPVRPGKVEPGEEGYYRDTGLALKKLIDAPVIQVGGIRTLAGAEALVTNGAADLCALCRPLIREPELIKRWQDGDTAPAACISDNQCFKPIISGKGVYCLTREKQGEDR
jgi:2,4-dienoyl-CoA reductase-like NADH-dependent reductase (Old Yellow Enzyme family)